LETDEDGNLLFRSDPALYVEGDSQIGANPTVTYVIRRQDTDAELIREMIAYKNNIGDWFFPIGLPLNATGPDGYGGTTTISGIWLHNFMTESKFDHFNFGPAHGPFGGKYCYGGIVAADLRSLSYIVFRHHAGTCGHTLSSTNLI
jgi:hypothetical protein